MPELAPPLPDSVAAVDLGSNSFHMIVARTNEGELLVLDRLREMVQLASGLDESRRLSPAAQERALDCLGRFGQRVSHMPAENVRAVGTNTFRSARDIEKFLVRAEEALGHSIETISGIEEARLIYLGVTQSLSTPASSRLVVDIGGGSTELIVGRSSQPVAMESLYMGCVSMARAHFGDGAIDAGLWRRAELAALQELEPIGGRYRSLTWDEAVGASGTVRSIDAVVRAAGWSQNGITPKALRRVRDAVLKIDHVGRLKLDGLNPARRAIFPAGVVLLSAIFESLGIERLYKSDGALREGLLHDLIGRIRDEDVRSRSVSALGDRYHVDRKQAGRVENSAIQLLGQIAEDWKLTGREPRQLLSWAAQLHEIGLDIAHAHYHKHGHYIVAQSDLFGFSREEQLALATLVRAHRRKFPASELKASSRPQGRKLERLAILLRLSAILHRSRSPENPPVPRVEVGKRSVGLRFPEDWLDGQPLTRADLSLEQDLLKAAGYRLEFA